MENTDVSKTVDFINKFFEHKAAVFGLGVLTVLIFICVFLPMFLDLDPYTSDVLSFGAKPSAEHLLGTDSVGRDIFSRFIYGGRVSLFVGISSVIIAVMIGVPLGLIAGYYKGFLEVIIMRTCDIFMAFPSMVLILVLVSLIGPSVISVTVVIGIMGWTTFARLSYSGAISVREKDYVESARAIGSSDLVIMTKYILPNIFTPLLVAATFMLAGAIITESSLSFLGMGVQIPQSSWGNMLFDAQSISVLAARPWQWLTPGIALVLSVISINCVGDGLRDALDPKLKL